MEIDEVKKRFQKVVKDAGLPAPDEVWQDGPSVGFRWTEHQLVVYVDPDRDDISPIDELEAAMIKGLPVDGWPVPTADGYRDYEPST
jgi:hypothetical protein